MTVNEIAELFSKKTYMLNMGSGKLSKWLNCSREDIYRAKDIARNKTKLSNFPKILVFDIETSPLKAYVWSRWKQNIYLEQTISEWFAISWSAKWLFSTEVISQVLTPEEIKTEDDSRIMKGLWKLIDEADIVIAHNGLAFDEKKINARFLLNGLPPTTPYQSIDTKLIATKQFGFSSNKLDALAGYFGIDHKIDTDFELWARCMEGDEEALKYMEVYNRKDVEILEEVYLKMRPWIKSHPNINLYLDLEVPACSNCGSLDLEEIKDKYYYTQTGKYPLHRCTCGTIVRGRKTVQDKEVRKHLLIGLAR